MTYVNDLKQIPDIPHWVIITTSKIYISGDERSRTNPGHGYSATIETTISYKFFTDEEEWKAEVVRMSTPRSGYSNPEPFKAMKVIPASIKTKIDVVVE